MPDTVVYFKLPLSPTERQQLLDFLKSVLETQISGTLKFTKQNAIIDAFGYTFVKSQTISLCVESVDPDGPPILKKVDD